MYDCVHLGVQVRTYVSLYVCEYLCSIWSASNVSLYSCIDVCTCAFVCLFVCLLGCLCIICLCVLCMCLYIWTVCVLHSCMQRSVMFFDMIDKYVHTCDDVRFEECTTQHIERVQLNMHIHPLPTNSFKALWRTHRTQWSTTSHSLIQWLTAFFTDCAGPM